MGVGLTNKWELSAICATKMKMKKRKNITIKLHHDCNIYVRFAWFSSVYLKFVTLHINLFWYWDKRYYLRSVLDHCCHVHNFLSPRWNRFGPPSKIQVNAAKGVAGKGQNVLQSLASPAVTAGGVSFSSILQGELRARAYVCVFVWSRPLCLTYSHLSVSGSVKMNGKTPTSIKHITASNHINTFKL